MTIQESGGSPRRIHLRGTPPDTPLDRLILGNKPMPAPFVRASEDLGDEIVITVKVTRRNFRDFAYLNVDEMCPAPDAPGYEECARSLAAEKGISEESAREAIAQGRATFTAAEEVAWNRFKTSRIEDQAAKFIHERAVYSSNFDTLFAEITNDSPLEARVLKREAERIRDEYEAAKPRPAVTETRGGKPAKWTTEAKREFQTAAGRAVRVFRDFDALEPDDAYGFEETLGEFPQEHRALARELLDDAALTPAQRACKYVAETTDTPTKALSTLERIFNARKK